MNLLKRGDMIDRILRNWKTTAVGLTVLLLCFVAVFAGKATLTEVSLFVGGGLFVLFSKDSMLGKKNIPCIFLFGLLFTCCRPYESFTDIRETVTCDTIVFRDSVKIGIVIPGDTVRIEADTIIYDTIYVEALKNKKFTLPPWDTCTRYAYARAGVTNNVPWLDLEQRRIEVDTMIYVNRIKILEQHIRELERQIVERPAFYENTFLWISVVLGVLLMRKYA